MMRLVRLLALAVCLAVMPPAGAQTILSRGSGLAGPGSVALDAADNVFVADTAGNAVKEITARSGYAQVTTLAGAGTYGPTGDQGLAFDRQGNLYYADSAYGVVYQALAADNFQTVKRLAGGFVSLAGIAVDAAGNVFVASGGGALQNEGKISEILAAGGYATVKTIHAGFAFPTGVAVDAAENVFVTDTAANGIYELEAASGYAKMDSIFAGGNDSPLGLALDAEGNLYVADQIVGPFGRQGLVSEVFAAGDYTSYQLLAIALGRAASVAVDGAGNVFVADQGSASANGSAYGAVKEIPAGGKDSIVTISTAQPYPGSVALDAEGNLYVASPSFAGVTELSAAHSYSVAAQYLADGLSGPQGVALDGAGNVFVADTYHGTVKEILAASGYTSVQTFATGFIEPAGLALDSTGNVFVSDLANGSVEEIPSGGGAAKLLTRRYSWPSGLAADGAGNLYVADPEQGTVSELDAKGGYQTIVPIGPAKLYGYGIALDGAGNLFLAGEQNSQILELQQADGYQTPKIDANGFSQPRSVAVDKAGDIFVADQDNAVVPEILPAGPTLFSAILPGSSLAVVGGAPATVFATLVNAGPATLTGCTVRLGYIDAQQATLTYQQTDPATNALVGSPNMPITVPGNTGSASLMLSLTGPYTLSEPAMAPVFGCTDGATRTAAPVIAGVNTLDFNLSDVPVPNIVALSAAKSGVLTIPSASGTGAFALASIDTGLAGTVTATPAASDASLPLTLTICPTNPATAACTAPPAATAAITYAANGTQTYSVFATAHGPIAFAPATARAYVRFIDAAGNDRGSTSVAVETQ